MKSSLLLVVAALIAGIAAQNLKLAQNFVTILQNAFENQLSNIQIQGKGVVVRGN